MYRGSGNRGSCRNARSGNKNSKNSRSEFSYYKKKGDTDLMWITIYCALLLIAAIFIFRAVHDIMAPERQMAFSNTELLRQSINKVCLDGSTYNPDNPLEVYFQLPQPSPPTFFDFTSFMPAMTIQTLGEPNYVLYYEAFPPGEAIGWEVYGDFQNRLIVPLPENVIGNGKLDEFYERFKYFDDVVVRTEAKSRLDLTSLTDISAVIYPNIILQNLPETQIVGTRAEIPEYNFLGDLGKWDDEHRYYGFEKYMDVPHLNKTLSKYRACGANSLCLKTKDGVYAFPLDYCAKAGIQYIQLEYKGDSKFNELVLSWAKVLGITAGAGAVAGGTLYLSNKVFSLLGGGNLVQGIANLLKTIFFRGAASTAVEVIGASVIPSATFVTTAGETATVVGGVGVGGAGGTTIAVGTLATGPIVIGVVVAAVIVGGVLIEELMEPWEYNDFYFASPCNAKIKISKGNCECTDKLFDLPLLGSEKAGVKYSLYEINQGKLEKVGEHISCLHRIGKEPNKPSEISENKITYIDNCIKIKIVKKEGCVSDNIVYTFGSFFGGFNPITDTTGFVKAGDANIFVEKPTKQFYQSWGAAKATSRWAWPY